MNQRVGVALVTANGEAWITELLGSIARQDLRPTRLVIVDDHSTDGTLTEMDQVLPEFVARGIEVRVETSTCTSMDVRTRIARNFTQAVRGCQDLEFVALSDQDDVWFPERLSVHMERMTKLPAVEFLAGNGDLSSGGNLFGAFEVPGTFNTWPPARQLRHVLRNSVATGGASILRTGTWMQSTYFTPPEGWLHDRWWSILAATHSALALDPSPVIMYRVHDAQQVGLGRGRQASSGTSRIAAIGVSDFAKFRHLHSLRVQAARDVQGELSITSLLRTLLGN